MIMAPIRTMAAAMLVGLAFAAFSADVSAQTRGGGQRTGNTTRTATQERKPAARPAAKPADRDKHALQQGRAARNVRQPDQVIRTVPLRVLLPRQDLELRQGPVRKQNREHRQNPVLLPGLGHLPDLGHRQGRGLPQGRERQTGQVRQQSLEARHVPGPVRMCVLQQGPATGIMLTVLETAMDRPQMCTDRPADRNLRCRCVPARDLT